MKRNYYIYDIETMPNCFTLCGKFTDSDKIYMFEISDRVNQRNDLITHLSWLRNLQIEMVGFNNLGFDYPIIHELMINPYMFDYRAAYQLAQTIITSQNNRFGGLNRIKPSERIIPQLDIYKICHFDNRAKTTSLKALQFSMRMDTIEDMPFGIRDLNDSEKDQLKKYNIHDVISTEKFFNKNLSAVNMRRDYLESGVLRGDVMNYSDTKIGVEYFIAKLGRGKCFSGGKPKQTFRQVIEFKNIILRSISFRTELFNDTFEWFKKQQVHISKKDQVNPKLSTSLAGLEFHFGIGGVHASTENKIFHSNDTHQIIDIDVTGMYPAVAIANHFSPEHLGESFVQVYKQIVTDRARYKKGTSQNAVLKLAANGVYGNSNNPYSPFYDPQYTFSVTVNGQLQILQLVELISMIPGLELIQVNTDGVTVILERKYENLFKFWCDEWEKMTGLLLEEVRYSRMWIKDVNNYIAETEDGKLKRKGAYSYPLVEKDYEGWWAKNYSNLASKIACEKVMTHSWPAELAIKLVTNPFDFMLRYKATGKSVLFIGDVEQLKTVRYYISRSGQPMQKVSPPKGESGQFKRKSKLKDDFFLRVIKEIGKNVWDERVHTKNKSKYETVTTSVQAGWNIKQCNVATDFDWSDVDWTYYIEECKKVIIGSK